MDPRHNPYAPGAESQPPELAGRDQILERADIALARIKNGRHAKGQFFLGLRGVGKTVLLNRIEEMAAKLGYHTVVIEAPEGRQLPELLVPPLRQALMKLDLGKLAKHQVRAAIGVLRSFASTFKLSYADIEVGMTAPRGVADSGDLGIDLTDLLVTTAEAARSQDSAIAILIDEVQYMNEHDLSALIVALHKISQKGLPLIMFGAGLPQLAALAGDAKSYAERLFDYQNVGPLEPEHAENALREPARRESVDYESDALNNIIGTTHGYPYFLQEWGKHVWEVADRSPITIHDAVTATDRAIRELDQGFFRVRLDRLTPKEKRYMRAMAELGAGPHRSGDIARTLKKRVTDVAVVRTTLIRKGMIYSPAHGDTAFTVPMFDEFLRRQMPEFSPE